MDRSKRAASRAGLLPNWDGEDDRDRQIGVLPLLPYLDRDVEARDDNCLVVNFHRHVPLLHLPTIRHNLPHLRI